MATLFRKSAKSILLLLYLILLLFFLLSCLAPISNPAKYWLIGVLGLGFPVLFTLTTISTLFWTVLRKRIAWAGWVALLLSIKSIGVSIAFHSAGKFEEEKEAGSVRFVSWNVARFIEWKRNNNKGSQQRLKILDQLQNNGGDILCLQEFFHSPDSTYYDNIAEIRAMGYPYHYFSYDPDGWKQYIGCVIFSKYPIIDSGMVRYFRPSMPEALLYVDVKTGADTIRVFTTHLQSVQFRKNDYTAIEKVKSVEDSLLLNSRTVVGKLKKALVLRSGQARVARSIMDDSPYPAVICGDFNDIPNSFTYHKIRGNMQDAFLEKGSGLGRTFSSLSPTLRIDYILADPVFEVKQIQRLVRNTSDHYMLRADLLLRKDLNP